MGVFTFVLPQSVVRTMGYKDVKSLHRAMIVGTVIIGAMMIGVTALGVLAAGVLTEDLAAYGGSVDNIIPLAISRTLPPVLAGIAIIGPVADSISTVSSLLISSSSALVKDVWMHYAEARGRRMGACAVRVEPGGYAGAGRGGVRAGRRAARRHMEDQHVRLRRP